MPKTPAKRRSRSNWPCTLIALVPEYLRAFCDERGRTPYRDEQALILETQHIHELAAAANARAAAPHAAGTSGLPLFSRHRAAHHGDLQRLCVCDGSLYARTRMLHQRYALTLLCMPDLGWVAMVSCATAPMRNSKSTT